MKRNHRKNRIWISIMLIVALLTPMLSTIALAEEGTDPVVAEAAPADFLAEAGPSPEEIAAAQAAAEAAAAQAAAEAAAAQAAAEAAAAQAAAEEAARIAAEQAAAEEAARIAAEQAAAEEAAQQAAAEEAARIAAEQAAAEEAARIAAEQAAAEEAARIAAEQAAAEEAARIAAEQAAAEEAARIAAEQAAAEEAARKAAEQGTVQPGSEVAPTEDVNKSGEVTGEIPVATPEGTPVTSPEVSSEGTPVTTPEVTPEATPEGTPETTPEVTPEATVEGTATQEPEVVETPVPEQVVTPAMAQGEGAEKIVIKAFNLSPTEYTHTSKPTDTQLAGYCPATIPAILVENGSETQGSVAVEWTKPAGYDSATTGNFEFTSKMTAESEATYQRDAGVEMPKVMIHIVDTYETESDGKGGLIITKWNGSDHKPVVPASIDGKQVTDIGEKAFANKTALESVTLPDGLESIGKEAFAGCTALETIAIPDSLKENVETDAFKGDDKLKTIKLLVYNKTTLIDDSTIAPTPAAGETIDEGDKVKLRKAVTDIEVIRTPKEGKKTKVGNLTFRDNYTLAKDHAITVDPECEVNITLGKKITNNGTITNKGTIHVCGSPQQKIDGEEVENEGSGKVTAEHNYPEGDDTCTGCGIIDISRIPGKCTVDFVAQTYDGSRHAPTVTAVKYNGVDMAAEEYELIVSTDETVYIHAGSYPLTLNGKGKYTGTVNPNYVISPAILTEDMVTVSDMQYTGSAITPTAVVKVKNGETEVVVDPANYVVSVKDEGGAINVREQAYTAVITGQGDYSGVVEKTFKITPKPITAEMINIPSQTYTGSALTPVVTVTDGSKPLTTNDYTLTVGGPYINAGSYALSVTGKGNYGGVVNPNFVITPKALTADMVSVANKVYDGNAITVNVAGLGPNDYKLTNADQVNAGTYTLTVSGTGNYAGDISLQYTISKADKEIEIRLKSGHEPTKVYDKTRNLTVTVNGTKKSLLTSSDFEFVPAITAPDKVSISKMYDKSGSSEISPHFDKVDVGTRSITVYFGIKVESTNYNYKLKTDHITISGTITPKTLTLRPGVAKSSTDTTLVPQSKVYGTADPSLRAKVGGLMSGDASSDAIGGKLARESGENVGKYKILINTVKGKGNYAEKVNLEEGYFEITPKSVNATDVGMVAIGNQKYTGSAIEPAITLKYAKKVGGKTETETLVKGKDFDVKYSNNVQAGTATVTITGKGNYTGSRTATFRILKVSTNTNTSTSTSTSSSSKTSSTASSSSASSTTTTGRTGTAASAHSRLIDDGEGEDDDEDDGGDGAINVKHQKTELDNMDMDELSALAEENGIDPTQYASKEELVKAIIAAERLENVGELVLDETPYGTILFGADDLPRPFLLYEEEIETDDSDEEAEDEEEESDFDEESEDEDWDEEEETDEEAEEEEDDNTPKRLRVEAECLKDADENDIFLDEEETREKFEELHLRLTPNQIEVMKSKNYVELVYELESAQLVLQLDELTSEIDVSPFEKADPVKLVKPESDFDEEEEEDFEELEEVEEGEDLEILEVEDQDATVMETEGTEMTPNMKEINLYDFCILQLTDENMTEREKLALSEKTPQYPYRLNGFAIHGELKENVVEAAEGVEAPMETVAPAPDAARYPVLGVLKKDQLRLIMDDEPYEDTQQVFVSDDETIQNDADAITFEPVNYTQDDDSIFAAFAPELSGMYSVVDEPEEEFEPLPGVTYGPIATPTPEPTPEPEAPEEPEASEEPESPEMPFELVDDTEEDETPEPAETPEPTPTPAPTPEPEPEVIEDPDAIYAYSRRSNEGNQYWLVNTVDKTVEYYSAIDDEHWTGEYTGSLMSGMDVKTDNGKIINIALKFQQTYKFALMNGDGPELLMEQDEPDKVDAELSAHR